jgi:hypothetical protein
MYNMIWDIRFDNAGKKFTLGLLAECEIECSVNNLVDIATIVLPESVLNQVLKIEDKISRGTQVTIKLGYDSDLKTEFVGYVQDITTNDSTLKILCEDALFLFRKGVKDVELKATSSKKIAQTLIDQIDASFTLSCDYDIPYEKFVIHQATGYDVLKKLQEETTANIYFDTQNKVLHIHSPYLEKSGEVKYSMHRNIEKSSLEYKKAIDKKIEVTIEGVDLKGKVTSVTVGTTGGEKITRKVGTIPPGGIKIMATTEYNNRMTDGYEGSFDTWLIPFVQPTYSAIIEDKDYPYKTGRYYVTSVKTNFSESGGKRTVTPGIKLGNG